MNVFVGITFGFLDMKASFSTDFEKITALGELKIHVFVIQMVMVMATTIMMNEQW